MPTKSYSESELLNFVGETSSIRGLRILHWGKILYVC